jgi:hypothetical protein
MRPAHKSVVCFFSLFSPILVPIISGKYRAFWERTHQLIGEGRICANVYIFSEYSTWCNPCLSPVSPRRVEVVEVPFGSFFDPVANPSISPRAVVPEISIPTNVDAFPCACLGPTAPLWPQPMTLVSSSEDRAIQEVSEARESCSAPPLSRLTLFSQMWCCSLIEEIAGSDIQSCKTVSTDGQA